MTKTKAIKMFRECSRDIIEPKLASKIADGLGYSLKKLNIKAKPAKSFQCLVYPNFENSPAIAIVDIAKKIIKLKGLMVQSPYFGRGTSCDYIVEQAIKAL